MKKVDIIGSCVVRDCFNSKFVPQYRRHFIINTYLPRIAIPAIMSSAIEYNDKILVEEGNSWYYECYYKSYGKYFLSTIANNQSDYLIMDFYSDVYLGVRQYGDSYVSYMANQKRTKSLDRTKFGKYYNYRTNQQEYKILWKRKFDEFMEFMRICCPNTQIILNGIKGSNQVLSSDKVHMPNVELTKLNSFWEELDDYVLQKYPDVHYIFFEKKYKLDPDYPFGGLASEFVHFEKSYYKDFFEALLQIANCKEEKNRCTMKSSGGVDLTSLLTGGDIFYGNLVKNSDFSHELKYWVNSNSIWTVEYINEQYYAKCCDNDNLITQKWCMSDAIEVNGDLDTMYTLSFALRVREDFWQYDMCIFKVLEYKNASGCSFEEASDCHIVRVSEENKGKEYFITPYTFCPKTKYVRVVMCLSINIIGSVLFSNIVLVKGIDIVKYQRCLDELYFEENIDFRMMKNVVIRQNLLKNGSFNERFKGWEYENARFRFKMINNKNWITVDDFRNYKSKYLWVWSDSIELPDQNSWYILSFDYFVYEKDSLSFKECMGIRGYNNAIDKRVNDAVKLYHVNGDAVKINTVYHREFSFQPKCRYIRIGIHLEKGKEHICITDICLQKAFF